MESSDIAFVTLVVVAFTAFAAMLFLQSLRTR